MTDIKELALRVAKEISMMDDFVLDCEDELIDFATRFLAAYLAEREPRGWWNPKYPTLPVQLTKPHDGGGWEPFYTEPEKVTSPD